MKKILITIIALIIIFQTAFSQKDSTAQKADFQLRQYWFVMLIAGNNRAQDSAVAAKIQEGHMANITKLYYDGKIKVAGPFGDNGKWRGIFIFDCPTKEEVEKLLQTDPAILSGSLVYEIHPWWTAAMGS